MILNFRSPDEEKDHTHIAHSAVRNVFGDSDEEEPTDYAVQNDIEHEPNVSTNLKNNILKSFIC